MPTEGYRVKLFGKTRACGAIEMYENYIKLLPAYRAVVVHPNYMAKYESGAEVRERDDDDSSDGDASDDGGVSAGARKDMPFIKEQSISTSFLNGVWSRRLVFLRHQPCAQLAVRRRYPSRRHCAKLQEM